MNEIVSSFGLATLVAAFLVMASVFLGLLTSKTGMPLLLIFMGIGMLAGENGFGGIRFNDFEVAFWVGNIALAIILLDGGLRTHFRIFRIAFKPALVLATVGVVLTCLLLTGIGNLAFGLPVGLAFLFGAIVASTDAAAVFSLMNSSGIRLNERVAATLEIESGLNDPMAVFLTILAISFLLAAGDPSQSLSLEDVAWMVAKQIIYGAILAVVLAKVLIRVLQIMRIERSHVHGLNALLVMGCGMFVFGSVTYLGGSGFLAIYIFGLVVGNYKKRFVKTIIPAMDGLAWLFQASMFLLLGLLVTPADLLKSIWMAVGLALVLMFVVRPLAVFPCLLPFHFSRKESLFISWVGLRGAVPIILATYPIIAGVDPQGLMLDLALAVVILSLLLQGSTLSLAAKKLGLVLPDETDEVAVKTTFGFFELDANAPAQDVANFYGFTVDMEPGTKLGKWFKKTLGKPPVVGDQVEVSGWVFTVKSMDGKLVQKLGVKKAPPPAEPH